MISSCTNPTIVNPASMRLYKAILAPSAANPWKGVGIVGGYVALGAIWGIIKWYFHASNEYDLYTTEKRRWLEEGGMTEGPWKVPDNLKDGWAEHLCNNTRWGRWTNEYYNPRNPEDERGDPIIAIKPIAWKNKGRIICWMAYWPFSAAWSMLDDIVYKLFKHIQRMLGGIMDKITDHIYRDTTEDF